MPNLVTKAETVIKLDRRYRVSKIPKKNGALIVEELLGRDMKGIFVFSLNGESKWCESWCLAKTPIGAINLSDRVLRKCLRDLKKQVALVEDKLQRLQMYGSVKISKPQEPRSKLTIVPIG